MLQQQADLFNLTPSELEQLLAAGDTLEAKSLIEGNAPPVLTQNPERGAAKAGGLHILHCALQQRSANTLAPDAWLSVQGPDFAATWWRIFVATPTEADEANNALAMLRNECL